MRVRRIELASGTPDQARALARTIRALTPRPPDLGASVAEIIDAVRTRGDAAIIELTRRFDSAQAPEDSRISPGELEKALSELDSGVRRALDVAITNVHMVAEADLGRNTTTVTLQQGQQVALQEIPVDRAGAYVPGGVAAYPSTVVMCCVPAKVAGVRELVVTTPPAGDGGPNSVVLAACALCGVDEVYAIGGVQAIAALAFGTTSVRSVDVIVGPGNDYVQEAKRQVTGIVGIDGIEGPSELVVIAEEQADAELVALDLGAQAEHGAGTLLALLSDSEALLEEVEAVLERIGSEHEALAGASVALVRVPGLDGALELANALAPEHLELVTPGAEQLAGGVRTSGCVFVGRNGGAAFGDYAAGSNHVLPTARGGRAYSPLGVESFGRWMQVDRITRDGLSRIAPAVAAVAEAEGLTAHRRAVEIRFEGEPAVRGAA